MSCTLYLESYCPERDRLIILENPVEESAIYEQARSEWESALQFRDGHGLAQGRLAACSAGGQEVWEPAKSWRREQNHDPTPGSGEVHIEGPLLMLDWSLFGCTAEQIKQILPARPRGERYSGFLDPKPH